MLIGVKHSGRNAGFSLFEVLITIVIVAFGLMALAVLQLKVQNSGIESYQRSQAVLLLQDMMERMQANRANAASYASTAVYGTGYSEAADCTGLSTIKDRDLCEWSKVLKGVSEVKGGQSVGGLVGGRGCVTQVTLSASSPSRPTYRVSVAWQGTVATVAPSVTCGQSAYGSNDARRRVATVLVTIADLSGI